MRRGFAVAVLSLLVASLAQPALANHICYPSTCPGGDAVLLAINSPGTLAKGTTNSVSVDGENNGDDSEVKTKLKASRSKVEKPKKVKMFVPADGSYTIFFGVTPKDKDKVTSVGLLACTTAKRDIDKSNDCGSTTVAAV